MKIKNRFTGKSICSFETELVLRCLEEAVKEKANLRGTKINEAQAALIIRGVGIQVLN